MSDGDWQRLRPLALVFLILNGLQRQVRENLFVFAGAGAGAAFTDWMGLRELLLIALVFILFSVLGAMIYHRRFRFRMETDAVRVRRGLFEQKELRVRFARVQNVQLGQPLYFRPFNLVRFSLETPGAADKEIELPGIDRGLAENMRDRISAARQDLDEEVGAMSSEPEAQPGESAAVFAPGPGRLLLHGLSSNQVWVIAGVFFYVGGNLLDRFGKRLQTAADRLLENGLVADFPESAWLLGLVVLVGFLLLLFGLSALLALMRYWRFILLEREGRLIAAGGLFDRREQTLRRTKVTGLVLRQSAVGRLLGCWSVIVRQTRSSEQEPGAGRNAFLVPGLRTTDRRLTENLLSGAVFPARFVGISPLFRRFAWSRLLLALILTVILLASVLGIDHWSLLAVALAAAISLPAVQLRFRHWGWALEGRLLWVRRGLLGRRIDGFALDQVQQARVTSSPYLRRHGLVGLELVLPQGTIGLPFLTASAAAELANRALAAAEQAPTHQV